MPKHKQPEWAPAHKRHFALLDRALRDNALVPHGTTVEMRIEVLRALYALVLVALGNDAPPPIEGEEP